MTAIRKTTGLLALAFAVFMPTSATGWKQSVTGDNLPISWDESCFYYSLNREGSDAIGFQDLTDLTQSCFAAWQDIPCSYYSFVATEPAGVDRVEFNENSGNVNLLVWRKKPEDWPHSISAVALTTVKYDVNTGEIVDADIEFNEAYHQFGSLDEYPEQTELIDLASTMTHEIGHCIGLDHSDVPESTMAAYAKPGETLKRTLAPDDILGLCHIYPVEDDPEICSEPYCGLNLHDVQSACIPDSDLNSGCGCRLTKPAAVRNLDVVAFLLSLVD